MAFAVPLVSTFELWCDSVTDRVYPENAPGKFSAISRIAAWNATTCLPIWAR